MNKKTKKEASRISQNLVSELMKDYDPSKPEQLIGKHGLLSELKKAVIERALSAELDEHLGYEKHEESTGENYRNGYTKKTIQTDDDQLTINNPRDRNSTFEPKLIAKNKRRFKGFDKKIISLYARGMTMGEIQGHVEDIYEVDVSKEFISNITDSVIQEVQNWQNRPLDKTYPVIFLDALVVKCKQDGRVINKAVYIALAINMQGHKEILGIWLNENEGAKFWLSIVTELKNRGLENTFIFCVDGLKGLPEAINSVFPQAQVQLCIVHLIRNSLQFVPYKNKRAVAKDLKKIYTALNENQARQALEDFRKIWDKKYPTIGDIWERNWAGIIPFLEYPENIRKVIYTTNTIESANYTMRKIIKNKQLFPNDTAVKKILFLALKNIAKKWTMPIQEWIPALNQFAIVFKNNFPQKF